MSFILRLLLRLATSKLAEEVVSIGVKKLLDSTDSGIKKDLAKTMINGIVASKQNPIGSSMTELLIDKLK